MRGGSWRDRRAVSSLRRVFRVLTFQRDPAKEIREEIEFHFQQAQEALERRGMTEADARQEVERRFGDVDRYAKELEAMERGKVAREHRMEIFRTFWHSLRLSLRSLRKAPGFSLGVILTLTLGIGANATIFGIVDRLLLSPPSHISAPDQVKRVYLSRMFLDKISTGSTLTYPDFVDLKKVSAFSSVAALTRASEVTLQSGSQAERISGILASWELFPLLGVRPTLGRFYAEKEEKIGAPLTVVLGNGFWKRRFGGDPAVLGQTLTIGGAPFTVIGVAPEGFTGIDLAKVDVWLPLAPTQAQRIGNTDWETHRGWWWLQTVARIAPDGSARSAEEQATTLHRSSRADRIAEGRYDPEARIVLGSVVAAQGTDNGSFSPPNAKEPLVARWLAGVSLLVLLIACANVANLLLARGVDRSRDVAIRMALGVSRARLIGQVTVETLILAGLGGSASLALTHWGGGIVRQALLPQVDWTSVGGNQRVLLFTLSVTILAGLLAGVLPAIQTTGFAVGRKLGAGERGNSEKRSRVSLSLSVLQAALSVVLLVGAGLFVRSLNEVRDKDLGLEVDQVALMTLEFDEVDLEARVANQRYQEILDRLLRLPGVTGGARTTSPFDWAMAAGIAVPGLDSIPNLPGGGPYYQSVDHEYFTTLGLELLQGRTFTPGEQTAESHVMVVSETMARTIWPDGSVLGRCVKHGGETSPCSTVIGVIEDASRGQIEEDPFMQYYIPLDPGDNNTMVQGAYLRLSGDPEETLARIRREGATATSGVRFMNLSTLREILDPQTRSWTLGATMFSVFGILALLVAGVGLYSVLAYNVARRRREMGIRAAVGARREELVTMVVGEGGRLTLLGVVLGVVLAVLAGPWVEPLLYGVSPRDPIVFGTVVLTLILVSLLASGIPAWRASRVDPAEALNSE